VVLGSTPSEFRESPPEPGRETRRVAFFLNNLSGGGAEKVVVHLGNWMASQGIEVHLLLCSHEGAYANAVDPRVRLTLIPAEKRWRTTVNLLRLGGLYSHPSDLVHLWSHPKPVRAARRVAQHLRKHRIGVLVSTLDAENVANALAKRWLGGRLRSVMIQTCVYTPDRQQQRDAHRGRQPYNLHFLETMARAADRIVAVSEGVAANLVEAGLAPAEAVVVIPNPLVRTVRCEKRDPAPLPARFVLAAGRLSPEKGFVPLIRAFRQLTSIEDLALVIAGEGPQRAELAELAARLGLDDRVQLCGFRTDLPLLMQRAKCFVVASRYEGFGNVLLEALAEGCPVVSTDCPGGPAEILARGRFGPLVPVDDVAALARAIADTLKRPIDRASLRQRARDFSIDRVGARYLEALLPGN